MIPLLALVAQTQAEVEMPDFWRHPLVVAAFAVLLTGFLTVLQASANRILARIDRMAKDVDQLGDDLRTHMATEDLLDRERAAREERRAQDVAETRRDIRALHQRLDRELPRRPWWERIFGGSRAA